MRGGGSVNKTAIVVIVVAVILLGGFLLLRGKSYQTSAPPTVPTAPAEESEVVSTPQTEQDRRETTATAEKEATIKSGSFFFKPDKLTVQSGKVTVNVSNNTGSHTFVIDKLGVKEQLSSGKTFTFSVEPGTYEYYCDVPGHKEQGMLGTLEVK